MLHQRHHDPNDPNFYEPSYYVHDRLGSVRRVVVPVVDEQTQTWVVRAFNSYTYTPFGQFYDGQCIENIANPWKFTGQWHDEEIDQYYLRARMYDPTMMRFTSRDPVFGRYSEPLTLHKYLYCINTPLNRTDYSGKVSKGPIVGAIIGGMAMHSVGVLAAAVGVETGNDALIALGILLEKNVAWGMLIGACAGTPAGQIAIKAIGQKVLEQGHVYMGLVFVVASEATNLALRDPGGFAEFFTNLFGDPSAPTTLGGAYGWLLNKGAEALFEDESS